MRIWVPGSLVVFLFQDSVLIFWASADCILTLASLWLDTLNYIEKFSPIPPTVGDHDS
jgi:hypothetical protein